MMSTAYYTDTSFEKKDYTIHGFSKGDYDNCRWVNCDFSKVNLSGIRFIECSFTDCNLSMMAVGGTVFNDVQFSGCKMIGVNFDSANDVLFSAAFNTCILDFSIFYKRNLKNSSFSNCQFRETDFSEADLSSLKFPGCDFHQAKFDNTNLEKADLSTAINYSIDPTNNKVKKATFSLDGLPGLLDRFDITIV